VFNNQVRFAQEQHGMDGAMVDKMLVACAGQEYAKDALNRPVVLDGLARCETAPLCTLRLDRLVRFLGQEAGSHKLLRMLERGVEVVSFLVAQSQSNSCLINDQGSIVLRIHSDSNPPASTAAASTSKEASPVGVEALAANDAEVKAEAHAGPYHCRTCTPNKSGRQQQCTSCARLQELASRLQLPPQEQVQHIWDGWAGERPSAVAQICADKTFVKDCSRVLIRLMKAHTSSSSLQALCCCAIFSLACLDSAEV
jgi:hypothetical protein